MTTCSQRMRAAAVAPVPGAPQPVPVVVDAPPRPLAVGAVGDVE
ncbi:hypothetical protein KIPB_015356, partial [Kipferlia bialata]|eukprot:g15356.t1